MHFIYRRICVVILRERERERERGRERKKIYLTAIYGGDNIRYVIYLYKQRVGLVVLED